MDQDQEKINTAADPTESATGTSDAKPTPQTAEESFDELLARSPRLSPLGGWLKCLRKPALSVQYSLHKRHVPDLDTDQGAGEPSKQPSGRQNPASGTPQGSEEHPRGKNSDVMGLTGGFTIRYFDFGLGILSLAILGCMMKGCRCLKRKMF